jgi:two-component system nitrogen regulation response regulator GlnG
MPKAEIGPAVEKLLSQAPSRPVTVTEAAGASRGPAERRRPSEVGEEELVEALRACRWDLQATADLLRISRPSLYALIEANPRLHTAGDLKPEEIARAFEECGGDLDAMSERLEVSRKALGRRLREMGLA